LTKDKEVFFHAYGGPGIPATYFIDQNGVIVEKFSDLQVWDAPEMKSRILQLMQKR
jgi:hypothetical protein